MFNSLAKEKLAFYVYALFDPNDKTFPFYIGKGKDNRIFDHINEALAKESEDNDLLSHKIEVIQSIKARGQKVIHMILRSGLTEDEAFKVEASLIDMINWIKPKALLNLISGHGIAEGFNDASDIADEYNAQPLNADVPILLIKIDKRWTELLAQYSTANQIPESAIYEAAKGDWKLNIARARNEPRCVLVVARSIVRAVIVPNGWEYIDDAKQKIRMTGQLANTAFTGMLLKSVTHIFATGNQNPVRYSVNF
jgi:uncharacterized protein